MRGTWTPEEDAYLRDSYRTATIEHLMERLGRSENIIRHRAKRPQRQRPLAIALHTGDSMQPVYVLRRTVRICGIVVFRWVVAGSANCVRKTLYVFGRQFLSWITWITRREDEKNRAEKILVGPDHMTPL